MANKKIGLALGSGGAKGIAHIGVLKQLEKNKIKIDYIAGSSIGALIGSLYSLHQDSKKIEKLFLQNNWRRFLRFLEPSLSGGLIKGDKLEKYIKEIIENAAFNDLKIPTAIVATDLKTCRPVIFKSGSLSKAILASMSVPLIFTPQSLKNKMYIDGGLSEPVPVDIARDLGAKKIIAVNLDNGNLKKKIKKTDLSLKKMAQYSIEAVRYNLAKKCVEKADVSIMPKIPNAGLIGWSKFFKVGEVHKIIEAGEKAATNKINKIKNL